MLTSAFGDPMYLVGQASNSDAIACCHAALKCVYFVSHLFSVIKVRLLQPCAQLYLLLSGSATLYLAQRADVANSNCHSMTLEYVSITAERMSSRQFRTW